MSSGVPGSWREGAEGCACSHVCVVPAALTGALGLPRGLDEKQQPGARCSGARVASRSGDALPGSAVKLGKQVGSGIWIRAWCTTNHRAVLEAVTEWFDGY